jgi:protein-tyrosine phosphatase
MASVLMVCLGNICRSPLAEGILRNKVEGLGLKAYIDSAGTSNFHIGDYPDRRSIANAKKHGIDISKLKARQFAVEDFDTFDFIFVMDESNYNNVISLARNEADIKKVDLILNCVFGNKNVPDPYYGNEEGFEEVFQLLDKACENIASGFKKQLNG